MKLALALSVLAALTPQDDPARQARDLIERLRSDKVEEREEAAKKLKQLGKGAVPELEKAAKDSDAEVAARAQRLLHAIEIREKLTPNLRRAMPGVEDRLASGQDHTWTDAYLEAGDRAKFPTLAAGDLEILAAPAVRGAGTEAEKAAVCKRACELGHRSAAREIAKLLAERNPRTQSSAENALLMMRAKEAVVEIVPLLKDVRDDIRRRATSILAQFGAKEAVPDVTKLLSDERAYVRASAAGALSALGAKNAISELTRLLEDKDGSVRAAGASALGGLGAKEAIPGIIRLLKDEAPAARRNALGALLNLSAGEAISSMVLLLKDPDAGVRWQAVDATAKLRGRESIPHLIERLKDGDWGVQYASAGALGRLRANEAAQEVAKLLKDEQPILRGEAAITLGKIGSVQARVEMVKLLKDDNPYVRARAAEGLGELGAREAIPELAGLLQDSTDPFTFGFLAALDMGRSGVKAELFNRFGHYKGRGGVQLWAASGVCALGNRQGAATLLEAPGRFPLTSLNALRQPENWRRMVDKRLSRDLTGTFDDLWKQIAAEAGLKAEITPPTGWTWEYTIYDYDGQTSLVEALRQEMEWFEYDFILEPDRVRFLPHDDAVVFWNGWWKAEQEKKK